MKQVISVKKNKFTVHNEFESNNLSKPYYLIEITVKELKYENDKYYYDIGYNYEFVDSDTNSDKYNNKLLKISLHPFYNKNIDYDGVIVYKNDMVTKMIEYLLMSDDELQIFTGSSTVQNYIVNIMCSLGMLWD
jgi:hypothetical protein